MPLSTPFEKAVKDYSTRACNVVIQRYQDRMADGSAFPRAEDGTAEETRAMLLGVAHAFGAMVLSLNISPARGMQMMEQIFQVLEESIIEMNLPALPDTMRPETSFDSNEISADGNPGSRRKNTVH